MIAGILLQEKSIRDPADTRLYDRLHERLVKSVGENGIKQAYKWIEKRIPRGCKSQSVQAIEKSNETIENFPVMGSSGQ